MRLLATLWTATLLLAPPAFAQSGNPAFMTPETGPEQPNATDRIFVHAAGIGGMAEVELGKLAEQKAQSETVKDFGRRMVEDHGKANDRLRSIANEAGIPVPEELDQEHKAMRDRLQALDRGKFELAYLQGQVIDHQKTVQLLEYEIGSGQQVDLKIFAAETLPVVLAHLRMAQDLQAEMTGKAY